MMTIINENTKKILYVINHKSAIDSKSRILCTFATHVWVDMK